MSKKFSWAGVVVVLICLGLMFYYYLIFRYTIETQILHHHAVIDNKSKQ